MRYSFATVAVALLGQTAVAAAAFLSVVELGPPSAASTALPHGSLHQNVTLRPDAIDPILLLCPGTNCQACSVIDMSSLLTDTCFSPGVTFVSAAFVVSNQLTLPFTPSVGTPGCASILELPTANTCFDLNGAIFNTFALID